MKFPLSSAIFFFLSTSAFTTAAFTHKGNVAGYQFAAEVDSVVDITHENFSCEGKTYGYYADQTLDCKVFHICSPVPGPRQKTFMFSFFCPEKTIFSQDSRTCITEEYALPCERAHTLYNLNDAFGRAPDNKPWKHTSRSQNTVNNVILDTPVVSKRVKESFAKQKVSSLNLHSKDFSVNNRVVDDTLENIEDPDIPEENNGEAFKNNLLTDSVVDNHRFNLGSNFKTNQQPRQQILQDVKPVTRSKTLSSTSRITTPSFDNLNVATTEPTLNLPVTEIDIVHENIPKQVNKIKIHFKTPSIVNFKSNAKHKIDPIPERFDGDEIGDFDLDENDPNNQPTTNFNTNEKFSHSLQSHENINNVNIKVQVDKFQSPIVTEDFSSTLINENTLNNKNVLNLKTNNKFSVVLPEDKHVNTERNDDLTNKDLFPPEILMPPPIIRFSEVGSTDSNVRHVIKLKTPDAIFQAQSLGNNNDFVKENKEFNVDTKDSALQDPINKLQQETLNEPLQISLDTTLNQNKQNIVIKKINNVFNKKKNNFPNQQQTTIPELTTIESVTVEGIETKLAAGRRRKTSRHKAIKISNSDTQNSHTSSSFQVLSDTEKLKTNLNVDDLSPRIKQSKGNNVKITSNIQPISKNEINLQFDINSEDKNENQGQQVENTLKSKIINEVKHPDKISVIPLKITNVRNRSSNRGSIRSQLTSITTSTPLAITSSQQINPSTSSERLTSRNRGSKRFNPIELSQSNSFGARTSSNLNNLKAKHSTEERNKSEVQDERNANEQVNNFQTQRIQANKNVKLDKEKERISKDHKNIFNEDTKNQLNIAKSIDSIQRKEISESNANDHHIITESNADSYESSLVSTRSNLISDNLLTTELSTESHLLANSQIISDIPLISKRGRNGRVRKVLKNTVQNTDFNKSNKEEIIDKLIPTGRSLQDSTGEVKIENLSDLDNQPQNNEQIRKVIVTDRKSQIKRIVKRIGKLNNTKEKEIDDAFHKNNVSTTDDSLAKSKDTEINLSVLPEETKASLVPTEPERKFVRYRGSQRFQTSDANKESQSVGEQASVTVPSRKRLRSRKRLSGNTDNNSPITTQLPSSIDSEIPILDIKKNSTNIDNLNTVTEDDNKRDKEITSIKENKIHSSPRRITRLRRPSKEDHSNILPKEVNIADAVTISSNDITANVTKSQTLESESITSQSKDIPSTSRQANRRRFLNKNLNNNSQQSSKIEELNNEKEVSDSALDKNIETNKQSRKLSQRRNLFRIKNGGNVNVSESPLHASNLSVDENIEPIDKKIILNKESKSTDTVDTPDVKDAVDNSRSPVTSVRRRIASRQRGNQLRGNNLSKNSDSEVQITNKIISNETSTVTPLDVLATTTINTSILSNEKNSNRNHRFRARTRGRPQQVNPASQLPKLTSNLKSPEDGDIVSRVFGITDVKDSNNQNKKQHEPPSSNLRLVGTSVKSTVSISNDNKLSIEKNIPESPSNNQDGLNDLELNALKTLTYVNEPLRAKNHQISR